MATRKSSVIRILISLIVACPAIANRFLKFPRLSSEVGCGVERFHQKFNKQLANNEFVAGDKFSVADITTITVVDFGHALEMSIPMSAPHVKRWYDQMQKRESVVKSKPTHMPDGSPLPIAA